MRKYFNMFPGANMKFGTNSNNASSGGMSVNIKCNDLNLLRDTSRKIEKLLKEQAGDLVTEVSSDLEDGLPQAEIVVDRAKMYELGLNIYKPLHRQRKRHRRNRPPCKEGHIGLGRLG